MTITHFAPQVLIDSCARPVLVYAKGRKKFRAVVATKSSIRLTTLPSLFGLRPLIAYGEKATTPKHCASFWLNHDFRACTKGAKAVLRGLVARKPRTGGAA
jgi:hypothetical protein